MINLKEFDIEGTKMEGKKVNTDIGQFGESRKVIATMLRDKNAEYLAEWIKRSAYKK